MSNSLLRWNNSTTNNWSIPNFHQPDMIDTKRCDRNNWYHQNSGMNQSDWHDRPQTTLKFNFSFNRITNWTKFYRNNLTHQSRIHDTHVTNNCVNHVHIEVTYWNWHNQHNKKKNWFYHGSFVNKSKTTELRFAPLFVLESYWNNYSVVSQQIAFFHTSWNFS